MWLARHIAAFTLLIACLTAPRAQAAPIPFKQESQMIVLKDGTQLEAKFKVPVLEQTSRAKLPALMVFGGFEEAGKVLDLLTPDRPVVLASFDYPYQSPRSFSFPASLKQAPEVKSMIHRTIEGIGALGALLRKRNDVDSKKIVAIGASLGAPFATIAAAKDEQVSALVLVHGFGDIPGTAHHQLRRAWGKRWGGWSDAPAWLFSRLAWWYIQAPAPEGSIATLRSHQKNPEYRSAR